MAQAAIELGVRDLETPFTSTWSDGWRRFRRSPSALIGLGIIFLLAVCATLSPQISGHTDPLAQNLTQPTMAPSLHHIAGTDKLGRDIFTRLLFGARLSVEIGFVSVGIALVAGTIVGLVSGFWGGRLDSVLMAVMDGYGLDGDDAVDAIRAYRAALHGFVSLEASGGFGFPASVDRSFGRLVHALVVALSSWNDVSEPGREVPA